MHSIFFGLRRYCSSYHQWHFSPRNLCFVYFKQLQKGPYLPGAKRNEKKSSFFRGSWRLWKSSSVLFLNWFPYPWPPEGGQTSPANFLTGREAQLVTGTQTRAQILFHPRRHPHHSLSCPPWHRRDSLQGEEKRIAMKKKKITKKFPHFFLAFLFFLLPSSKPATLGCAPGLINMNQTGNDQREWEISKG